MQLPCSRAEKGAGGPHRRSGQATAAGETEGGSWPDILADLDSLTETEVEQTANALFSVRPAPRPAASLALRAVGVALPPTIRQIVDD